MLLNLNMIKEKFLSFVLDIKFQDVVKFEYDKRPTANDNAIIAFQDVVKFEYDKSIDDFMEQNSMFQDVVKFEYDKS